MPEMKRFFGASRGSGVLAALLVTASRKAVAWRGIEAA
jgi:hypothetical protein